MLSYRPVISYKCTCKYYLYVNTYILIGYYITGYFITGYYIPAVGLVGGGILYVHISVYIHTNRILYTFIHIHIPIHIHMHIRTHTYLPLDLLEADWLRECWVCRVLAEWLERV
jgi:hypothetical protein